MAIKCAGRSAKKIKAQTWSHLKKIILTTQTRNNRHDRAILCAVVFWQIITT